MAAPVADEITPDGALSTEGDEVTAWLTELGLECYAEAFRQQHVCTITDLRNLSENHLKELGVAVGHRVRIAEKLKASNPSPPGSPTAAAAAPPPATAAATASPAAASAAAATAAAAAAPSPAADEAPAKSSEMLGPAAVTRPELLSSALPEDLREEVEGNELIGKVVVVGDPSTGKTSLIRRYTKGQFSRTYKATIGVDFALKQLQFHGLDVQLQMWDIGGQERFTAMTRSYYRNAAGAILVFDVTRRATWDAVLRWKADIDAKLVAETGESIPILLLGNKCDSKPAEFLDTLDLDDFVRSNGFVGYFSVSALSGAGIDAAGEYLVAAIVEAARAIAIRRQSESRRLLRLPGVTGASGAERTDEDSRCVC